MPSTLRELNFLAEALLLNPVTREKMLIQSSVITDEYLEIILIDKHSKETMWRHRIYTEEIPMVNHPEENVTK